MPRPDYVPPNPRLKKEGSFIRRREPGIQFQPMANVEWVDPNTLYANDFNPNRVHSLEMRLLKISLLEIGWTAPVIAKPDGEIVDGFHRWTVAKNEPEVREMTEEKIPVVRVDVDRGTHILSTVRMNRARGSHHVVRMADLVAELAGIGMSDEEIAERAQMQEEEVFRLKQRGKMTERAAREEFGDSWAPDDEADKVALARVAEVRAEREAESRARTKAAPVRGRRD